MEYRKISELHKLEGNPRIIRDKQFEILCESIKNNPKYFEARPIILSNRTDKLVIIAGNQRYEAARTLKLKKVPTFIIEGLSEIQENEITIRDNISNGEWDFDMLANQWSHMPLDEWGVDLPEEWMGKKPSVEPQDAEPQIDRAEELNQKWQVKNGDLWLIGEHRLLCGDSTKSEDVARVMGGEKADAIVADPPYGMRLDADFSGMKNNLKFAQEKGVKSDRKYEDVIGDHEDFNAEPVILAIGNPEEQYWFGADYYSSTLPDTEHSGAWLVWDKRINESADRMFGSCFELIWTKRKCKRDIIRIKWAGIFGTEHESQRGRQHPNQKPVVLLQDIVGRTDGVVIDPFLGSGTTMVACQNLYRKCRGIEISPAYCAVILERMITAFPNIDIRKSDEPI